MKDSSSETRLSLSPDIKGTLDPCIVLMKDLVGQFQDEWKDDPHGILSLAQGVVYWEPPEGCQDLSGASDLHKYGPEVGSKELTEALKQKIQSENGLVNHIPMVTAGANQAYMNCVLSICDRAKKHVVFVPYYFNHVMALQMACGDDSIIYGKTCENGIPDIEWLESMFEKSDIQTVTIVHPANPTGVVVPSSVLERASDACTKHGAWLLLDGTYEYFATPGSSSEGEWIDTSARNSPSSIYFTREPPPNVLVIGSFSKSYALAGYRCGYACLHNDAKELQHSMLKVQDTVLICPPAASQAVAGKCMTQAGSGWVKDKYKTLGESRKAILDALKPLNTIGGDGAMYVMAELAVVSEDGEATDGTETIDDVAFCRELVKDHGIAAIPGTYCGMPGWVRICYANLLPEITIEIAAPRLRNGVRGILSKRKLAQASVE